jgi:hypothetical protein
MIREQLDRDIPLDEQTLEGLGKESDEVCVGRSTKAPEARAQDAKLAKELETVQRFTALKGSGQKAMSSQGCCEMYWQQAALQLERLQSDVEILQGNFLCLEAQLQRALYRLDELVSEAEAARMSFSWAPKGATMLGSPPVSAAPVASDTSNTDSPSEDECEQESSPS